MVGRWLAYHRQFGQIFFVKSSSMASTLHAIILAALNSASRIIQLILLLKKIRCVDRENIKRNNHSVACVSGHYRGSTASCLTYREATANSSATQEQVDNLTNEVKKGWWKKNRKRFIK